MELVTLVASASEGTIIMVIMSAGGVNVTFSQNLDNISTFLWVGYLGQGEGDAIA